MAPDIVDGPINFPPPLKEASATPLMIIPEIKKHTSILEPDKIEEPKKKSLSFFQRKDVKWGNVVMITVFHIIAAYGFLTIPYIEKWNTFLWGELFGLSFSCKYYFRNN